MMGAPIKPALRDEFQAQFDVVVAAAPSEKHAFLHEFFELCCDIDLKMRDCNRLLRDCNVILARTNGRMDRFFATGVAQ